MNISIHPNADQANVAATARMVDWLSDPATRNVMVAAGHTPLELYRRIGKLGLQVSHLRLFALDEYVGVPLDEPRNCGNLLWRSVVEAWKLPDSHFFTISSIEAKALASVKAHERRITKLGGLDVIVLGLGQNGHLGFNEPGSKPNSVGRILELEPSSIEANRQWFGGKYAPSRGVTVGLRTILLARHVLIMAYGSHKSAAVQAMIEGQHSERCPASFLQRHSDAHVFLDEVAAAGLKPESVRAWKR